MSAARTALQPLFDLARRAGGALVDVIYPPACLVCRRAIAEQDGLCPACWREIAFIERPFCERLSVPFERDLGQPGLISLEAAAHPPVFARARAVARYDSDGARALAYRLKYRDRLELAEPIGRWMARAGAELLAESDLIAPVPLHRRRLFTRQFNQSAALAQVIARESGVPLDSFAMSGSRRRARRSACRAPSAAPICLAPSRLRRSARRRCAAVGSFWSTMS